MGVKPVLPDLIAKELKILFIGINPGLRSAAIGHHFAGHSNRFWRLLTDSRLTPVLYQATEDQGILELGYGITNIVPRPSAAASELTAAEFQAGAAVLRKLILRYQPFVAAYVGKVVYQSLAGRREFAWGRQNESLFPGVIDFVLPNPSGLNRMPYPEQLKYYIALQTLISKLRDSNPRLQPASGLPPVL